MKIIDIKLSDPVYIPLRQMTDAINILPTAMTYTFLQIFTDEGMTGIGPTHDGALNKVLIEDFEAPGYRRGSPEHREDTGEDVLGHLAPASPTYLLTRLLAFLAASTAFLA